MTAVELALVLLSALLHALWSVAMKGSRNPFAFNLVQLGFALVGALALLPFAPLSHVPGVVWALLVATGVAHGLYFYWLTRALETGDLSLVYPIARSTPALLPLLAVPLLGEALSLAGVLGIAVVVGGIWFVHMGRDLSWARLVSRGAGWAYLTLAATVAYSLLDKEGMTQLDAHPWTGPVPVAVVFYFLIVALHAPLFALLALPRVSRAALRSALREEGRRALGAALVSFVGYVLILQALRSAEVSYVVAVRQTSVLFAVVLAVLWLGERPDRPRVFGACAIVMGVALIAFGS